MRIQKTCGKKIKRFKIGGSLTVEGKYEPVDHSKASDKNRDYPEGYITWRKFCIINEKSENNYEAFKKFEAIGVAETFKGVNIIREDTVWPKTPTIRISYRMKNGGF